jgi:hypothetical protein
MQEDLQQRTQSRGARCRVFRWHSLADDCYHSNVAYPNNSVIEQRDCEHVDADSRQALAGDIV